jgi:hypothetical protein
MKKFIKAIKNWFLGKIFSSTGVPLAFVITDFANNQKFQEAVTFSRKWAVIHISDSGTPLELSEFLRDSSEEDILALRHRLDECLPLLARYQVLLDKEIVRRREGTAT